VNLPDRDEGVTRELAANLNLVCMPVTVKNTVRQERRSNG